MSLKSKRDKDKLKVQDIYDDSNVDKLSAQKEGDKAPSYYDEYDEEYESEEEEQEATEGPQAQVGGWTEKGEGDDGAVG